MTVIAHDYLTCKAAWKLPGDKVGSGPALIIRLSGTMGVRLFTGCTQDWFKAVLGPGSWPDWEGRVRSREASWNGAEELGLPAHTRLCTSRRSSHVGLELRDKDPCPLLTVTDVARQMGQGWASLVMAQI